MTVEKEKKTVAWMIHFYCRKKHQTEQKQRAKDELCPGCGELLTYALQRLDHCRYRNTKKACRNCLTHCYQPAMREKIRQVMRFSGPRMIIYAPLVFASHYLRNK